MRRGLFSIVTERATQLLTDGVGTIDLRTCRNRSGSAETTHGVSWLSRQEFDDSVFLKVLESFSHEQRFHGRGDEVVFLVVHNGLTISRSHV